MTLVRPVLKDLYSPDADLVAFSPEDPENFSVFVQAMFGPEGSEGEESFDIVVCTPAWLARELQTNAVLFGRHYLIVARYEYETIRAALMRYSDTCLGATWHEVALKLARIGHWEFEDYKA